MNPLTTIDNLVLDTVNTINYVWNWTTGRIKTDLAYTLMIIGPALFLGQTIINKEPPLTIGLATATGIYTTIDLYQSIRRIEQGEAQATAQKKSHEAEQGKQRCKIYGYVMAGASTLIYNLPLEQQSPHPILKQTLCTSYPAILSLAAFMTLAENLPPRKNCISRGIDKLTQLAKNYQPAHQTIK